MLVKIFSIILLPLLYFIGLELFKIIGLFNLNITSQLYFMSAMAFMFVISMIFVSANSFFAVFNHELCHMLWSILSFRKPKSFVVSTTGKGSFEFSGKKNMMIVLSPYFFPIYAIIFVIFSELTTLPNIGYFIFGALCGWTLSVQIKQSSPRQSDLKIYGIFFSYIIIIFFHLLNFSLIFTYLQKGSQGIFPYFHSIYKSIVVF